MNQQQPKDLLELPEFQSLKNFFKDERLMHRCDICGEYNFETEMFEDPTLGWVDNACLDAHIDQSLEHDDDVAEFKQATKDEQRWDYERDLPVFDGRRG